MEASEPSPGARPGSKAAVRRAGAPRQLGIAGGVARVALAGAVGAAVLGGTVGVALAEPARTAESDASAVKWRLKKSTGGDGAQADASNVEQVADDANVLLYRTQRLLGHSPVVKITMLFGTLALLCVIGGFTLSRVTGSPLGESVFRAYTLLNDCPGADACVNENPRAAVVSNLLFLTGIFTFAIFLGIISDVISTRVDELRTGNYPVIESGHTVLLNWNDQTMPLLRQLDAAAAEGREGLSTVVILADKSKEDMDGALEDLEMSKIVVVTRSGTPYSAEGLRRVAVRSARNVVVMHPNIDCSAGVQPENSKAASVLGLHGNSAEKLSVVVQMEDAVHPDEDLVAMALTYPKGDVDIKRVYGRDSLARVFAQCAVNPGMSQVYAQLLQQSGEGSEFYTRPCKWLEGRTFGSVWRSAPDVIVVGVIHEDDTLDMNPPEDLVLSEGDVLVVIGKDNEFRINNRESYTTRLEDKPAPPAPVVAPMHVVVTGNDEKLLPGVVEGLCEFVPPNSKVTVLNKSAALPSFSKPPGCRVKVAHVVGDPVHLADMKRADVSTADAVVVLPSTSDADGTESDARLLTTLLLTDAANNHKDGFVHITGALHSENTSVLVDQVWPVGATDLIQTDDMVAGALMQAVTSPELTPVLKELLEADGDEIFCAKASRYSRLMELCGKETSFWDAQAIVRAHQQILLGYIPEGSTEPILNPSKTTKHEFKPGDRLIILGDVK